MTQVRYTTPFSITSQFGFCGLPLRLDTYRGCSFRCTYCFARHRGGHSCGDIIVPADPTAIGRLFERALDSEETTVGVIGQFVRRRVPLHLGGMSDPFQPAENHFHITESVLQALVRWQYPTVISTRGVMVASRLYVDLLREIPALVVQFSFSTTVDEKARRVEPRCERPTALMDAMESLANKGIIVTCRWQPYIPGISEEPSEFLSRVASAGCRHVAFEHLKVPLERSKPLWQEFVSGVGRDLHAEYRRLGAIRDGREFILPAKEKLSRVLEVARLVHRHGMTFGAADNEFQYLSDTECCCSGIDQFAGFEHWFGHQIGHAVRRCRGKEITYDSIAREWTPTGSIDRYLNSRSRLSSRTNCRGTLREHIRARWNNPLAPGSPASFYGVLPCHCHMTAAGNLVYRWA